MRKFWKFWVRWAVVCAALGCANQSAVVNQDETVRSTAVDMGMIPETPAAARAAAVPDAGRVEWVPPVGSAEAAGLSGPPIKLRGNDLPLGNILNQLARAAKLAVVLDKDVRPDLKVTQLDLDGLTLDGALAVVLTPFGYSYEVEPGRNFLRVFVYSTRNFRVAMPVVVQNWSAAISNSGDPGGGGAGAGASSAGALGARIAMSTRSDTNGVWEEVDKSLARLLGTEREAAGGAGAAGAPVREGRPELGAYSINRVAGFVTVRALPTVMPTIESYFSALNSEMGRVISIEVRVMQVDLNDENAAGIDWNLAAATLGGVVLSGGAIVTPGLNTAFNGSAFTNNTADTVNAPVLHVGGRAGDAFVRALEKQGKVRVMAQPTLALGNNLPSVIELAEVKAYVYQLTSTIVQGGAAQTTVQTASLSDGLMFSVMPRVLENGEVQLALGVILQDIIELPEFRFPGGSVQLPHTARRSYSGVVHAKLNETLVLGGLITTRKEQVRTGLPFLTRLPIIGVLFGTLKDVDRKSELVLTVTPREVQQVPTPPIR